MRRLLVLFLCLGLMVGCSEAADSEDKKEDEAVVYKLNEDIIVDDEYRLRFTKVEEVGQNEYLEKKEGRIVLISYEYENMNSNSGVDISFLNMKVYDKENNALDSNIFADGVKYGDSVSKGRKDTAAMGYWITDENNYVEIEFYDNILFGDTTATICLEW